MNSALEAGQHSAWASATTKDEQDVLRARVDVLNTLMQAPDARLCLENTAPTRVCVVYDRIRVDPDKEGAELGPMQSTMTWVVPGAEDEVRFPYYCVTFFLGDRGADTRRRRCAASW